MAWEICDQPSTRPGKHAKEDQGRPVPGEHTAQRPNGHGSNTEQVEGARAKPAAQPSGGSHDHCAHDARAGEDPMDLEDLDAQAGHDLGEDQRGVRGINGKGDEPQAQ